MKTKLLLIIGFFLITAFQIKAQTVWKENPFDWQNAYGNQNADFAGAIYKTTDNSYILAGWTETTLDSLYVVKTDLEGDIIWERRYKIRDFSAEYMVNSVCEGEDDFYYNGGGGFLNTGPTSWKPILVKINSQGDTLWSKVFNGTNVLGQEYSFFNNLIKGNDNSIIATGLFEDYKIIKFDYNGDTVWSLNRQIDKIFAMGDNYIAFEHSTLNNMIFISENGEAYNQMPAPFEIIQNASKTYNNLFLIKGYDINTASGIAKIDENGEIIFKNTNVIIQNSPVFIEETLNNKILCLGVYYDYYSTNDFKIYLLDEEANLIKDTILYRPGLSEYPRGLLIADDGDYILFGWGEDGPIGGSDLILAKMSQWNVTDINEKNFEINIFPNPATNFINISLSDFKDSYNYQIIDITGTTILSGTVNSNYQQINIQNLQLGIYFINILSQNNKQIFNSKLLKL
ncbi:MAG: T9SS type A sorting domain-containing protein [Bacteroidales bacterium]|nr:T9SS type A sorting domain-containing protein [Bacteroidales bacterium]